MSASNPKTPNDDAMPAAIRNPALLALIAETGLRLAEIANLSSSSTLFVYPTTTVAANLVFKRLASHWRRWPVAGADPTPEAPGEPVEPPLRQAKRPRRTTKRGKAAKSVHSRKTPESNKSPRGRR